jgi:D-3-phosphoglycerate dehydrogenase
MRILSLAPLAGDGLDAIAALGDLELDPWIDHVPVKLHSPSELLRRLGDVGVLIVEADHVPAAVLSGALMAIASCRGNPVNVDVAAATVRSIPVLNAPGRNADAVAELTLGMIIGLLRGIVAADDDVRAGRTFAGRTIPQQRYRGRELASITVGLVGFGAVGRAAARKLAALGSRVVAHDPHVAEQDVRAAGVEPVDLETLMRSSDVVSLHCPLFDETRGLISAKVLELARPGALLVNTARYDVVDEAAVLEALSDGRLGGAAFDHFANETLPPHHPLSSMPNVILTPHIGGTTIETVHHHSRLVAEGLTTLFAGRAPANVVNPEALEAFFSRLDHTR